MTGPTGPTGLTGPTGAGVSLPVSIANGGTGQTTASAARTALGAAASGANTDITSIALTTGTITTIPAATTNIANKIYVDNLVAGLASQVSCDFATTADLGTVSYSNGTSGVGATLTKLTPLATLSIDGQSPVFGQRILVKNQTSALQNGVYTVTSVGSSSVAWVLTRATDYDSTSEIAAGDAFYVELGTANTNTQWVQQTQGTITLGVTSINFIQFGGSSSAGIKQPYSTNGSVYAASTTTLTTGTLPTTGGGTGLTTFTAANNAIYSTSSSALTAGTLPIAAGGTNATTASGARTSLGAAASGSNTDITSIALTTGTVSTTPAATTDLANKNYVDTSIAGLTSQIACQYATAADLGAVTYSNGTSGVGATLTKTTPFATLSIDGASPTVGQRILVKSQTTTLQNGVYTVTNVGSGSTGWVLTRATDYDQTAEISAGDAFYIIAGSTLANTTWVQQTPSPVTVGTTAITFLQFGGSSGIKQPYAANGAVYATSTTALTTGTLPTTGGGTGLTTFTAANNAIYSTSSSALTAGTLPIAAGGTGATTASTALSNLGGASTGKAIAMSIVFGGG